VAHPRHKVEKKNRIWLDRFPDPAALRQMEKGGRLGGVLFISKKKHD